MAEHNAGIQVLNTSNFPDTQGPLFLLGSALVMLSVGYRRRGAFGGVAAT